MERREEMIRALKSEMQQESKLLDGLEQHFAVVDRNNALIAEEKRRDDAKAQADLAAQRDYYGPRALQIQCFWRRVVRRRAEALANSKKKSKKGKKKGKKK
jgi:hypothetical protein